MLRLEDLAHQNESRLIILNVELLRYIPYALGGGYVLGRALIDFIATNSHQVSRGSIYCITQYIICSTYHPSFDICVIHTLFKLLALLSYNSSTVRMQVLAPGLQALQPRDGTTQGAENWDNSSNSPRFSWISEYFKKSWVIGWLCRFDTEWKSRGCSNKFLVTHKQVDKLEKKTA